MEVIEIEKKLRNVQLKINLKEDEKDLFEKKMKIARCKMMNYFLRIRYFCVNLQPFREIQESLFRYASSVNQIDKRVNSTDVISSVDIKDMQSQIEHLS